MDSDLVKLAQLWTTVINDLFLFEWKRLRTDWEPRLQAALGKVVGDSLRPGQPCRRDAAGQGQGDPPGPGAGGGPSKPP